MFTRRSPKELYKKDSLDRTRLQDNLEALASRCSYDLVDKINLMLKQDQEDRRTAAELLKMFEQMITRRIESEQPSFWP
jgi:hypothetical protein